MPLWTGEDNEVLLVNRKGKITRCYLERGLIRGAITYNGRGTRTRTQAQGIIR